MIGQHEMLGLTIIGHWGAVPLMGGLLPTAPPASSAALAGSGMAMVVAASLLMTAACGAALTPAPPGTVASTPQLLGLSRLLLAWFPLPVAFLSALVFGFCGMRTAAAVSHRAAPSHSAVDIGARCVHGAAWHDLRSQTFVFPKVAPGS